MRILSWNIQCGKGCDGVMDLSRAIDYIQRRDADTPYDLICLQELARNMPLYCAQTQPDQLAMMQAAFPSHTAIWGHGFSWPGEAGCQSARREFGNLTLVRSDVLDYRVHPLPMPAAPNVRQMQRTAIEVVVASPIGEISVINSHLAFHDINENLQQVKRLCELERERAGRQTSPGEIVDGCYAQAHLPVGRILCGDFNYGVDSDQYRHKVHQGWADAWKLAHGDIPHAPTCGVFDHVQWPEGPHCRDFFWLNQALSSHDAAVAADTETTLSDHQPITLWLDI